MKKLKLKLDGIKEMLSKEQMKKINGGYDGNDVRCIVVWEAAGVDPPPPPTYSEYICYGSTDTGSCYAAAYAQYDPIANPGIYADTYVQSCYVF